MYWLSYVKWVRELRVWTHSILARSFPSLCKQIISVSGKFVSKGTFSSRINCNVFTYAPKNLLLRIWHTVCSKSYTISHVIRRDDHMIIHCYLEQCKVPFALTDYFSIDSTTTSHLLFQYIWILTRDPRTNELIHTSMIWIVY